MARSRRTNVTLTVLQWQILRANLRRPEEYVPADELGFSHTSILFDSVCQLEAAGLLVCRDGADPTVAGRPLELEYAMTAAGMAAAEYGSYPAEIIVSEGKVIGYVAIQPPDPSPVPPVPAILDAPPVPVPVLPPPDVAV